MDKPSLQVLDREFTIHRLAQDEPIPAAVLASRIYWLGKTDEELSIVCDSSLALAGGAKNTGWSGLKVVGPLDFSITGLLAGIAAELASAHISIFAISTFDTDYILVKSACLEKALRVLSEAGYGLTNRGI